MEDIKTEEKVPKKWTDEMIRQRREYARRYYAAHRDKFLGYVRRWREKNKEKWREYSRRWREKNRERMRELARRWREKQKQKKAQEATSSAAPPASASEAA